MVKNVKNTTIDCNKHSFEVVYIYSAKKKIKLENKC